MITLNFHFDSIDAAIEFLRGRQQRPQEEQPATDATEKKERKPRSDAGQPRGPYKRKDELPAEAAAPATVPAESLPAAPAAAEQSAPVEAPKATEGVPTLADVRAAMTGRSTEKNIALLKKFGYAKSSDLPTTKYADFIAACKRGE